MDIPTRLLDAIGTLALVLWISLAVRVLLFASALVVAFTFVRRADAVAGYVLGGAIGLHVFASCIAEQAREFVLSAGSEDAIPTQTATTLTLQTVVPFASEFVFWLSLIFVLMRLARKVPRRSSDAPDV